MKCKKHAKLNFNRNLLFLCISSELPLYFLLLGTVDLHKATLQYIKALFHPDNFLILIMQVLFCSEVRYGLIFELQKQEKNST